MRLLLLTALIVAPVFVTAQTEAIDAYDSNGNTQLTAAVLLSDETKARELIGKNANPNLPNTEGNYPITIAAKNRNLEMVNVLLEGKANPNVKDVSGHCALFYAVEYQQPRIAQALLIAKADAGCDHVVLSATKQKNKEMLLMLSTYNADFTPGFDHAASVGDIDMFRTLVTYGGKLKNNTPFNKAVDINNKEIATLCLDNGANVDDGLNYAMSRSNSEITSLCLLKGAQPAPVVDYAIKTSDTDLIKELIDVYKVSADDVLKRALITSVQTGDATYQKVNPNLLAAEAALQRNAQPDPHLEKAVTDRNTALVDLLLKYNADASALLKPAVTTNQPELVDKALKAGAKPSDPTLLKTAVDTNSTEVASSLISAGADCKDPALISTAVSRKNTEITTLLLRNGASATDPKLIEKSVGGNDQAMTDLLIQYGANPTDGMQTALNNNNTSLTAFLLDKGASALEPEFIAAAAARGNKELVEKLVEKGANVDNGMQNAVAGGKEDIFVYLVGKGANALKTDLVASAVSINHIGIFNRLMDLMAPVDYIGPNNENLLHIASRNQSYPMCKRLLERGVQVNQKTNSGDTPLHFAADSGRNNVDLCKLLVDNGADVNASNNRGKNIYKVADGKKLKKYLKSAGARK